MNDKTSKRGPQYLKEFNEPEEGMHGPFSEPIKLRYNSQSCSPIQSDLPSTLFEGDLTRDHSMNKYLNIQIIEGRWFIQS